LTEPDVAAGEGCCVGAEADPSRAGSLLHPLGKAYCVSDRGVGHVAAIADRPDHDFTRVEPDPDREVEIVGAPEFVTEGGELLLELEGCEASATRMILTRDRSAEDRHDPVARELVDGALEFMDAISEDLEEAVHDRAPVLGIDPLRELHRIGQISEQDRDLLSLPLQAGASRANPGREVGRRRNRVRGGGGIGRTGRGAAGFAELSGFADHGPAARAAH
jgi:hypothetical protein